MQQSRYRDRQHTSAMPVAMGVAAYGRFVRGDLEGAIELGERAVVAADQLAIDGSGLAERALGNAWFYRGDAERGVEWMDRMIASANKGSAARLAHACICDQSRSRASATTSEAHKFAGRLPTWQPPSPDRPRP